MNSRNILKLIFILGCITSPITAKKESKDCLKLKESGYCKSFLTEDKKVYIGPSIYKSLNYSMSSIKDFDSAFSNLKNNPVYPIERQYLEDIYGCGGYEPVNFKMTNRYVYTFHCSDAIYVNNNCNKDFSKMKKMCKSSCLIYYDAIKSIFNNTQACPDITKEQKRNERLQEILNHCNEYTTDADCIMGVDSEYELCGFRSEDSRQTYCNDINAQDKCCEIKRQTNNSYGLLNAVKYIGIGIVVLLIVVLVVLKIYSTNKNKRDKISQAETEALEKKRQEEREKYREQLAKEFESNNNVDNATTPLLNQVNINSPYNSPRPPPPAQNNNPNVVHRLGPQNSPYASPRPVPPNGTPRNGPVRQGSREMINGPRQPQHQGSREGINGPRSPQPQPQRQGSREGSRSPHPKESPRNSPAHPPHGVRDSPRNGPAPRNSPNHPPHGVRDSPRNSPGHPPHIVRDSPRNGPNHPPQPGHERPALPSNNNRY